MPTSARPHPRRRRALIAGAGALLVAAGVTVAAPGGQLLTSGPGVTAAGEWTNIAAPTFKWQTLDTGNFSWEVDGGSVSNTTATTVTTPALADGQHTFTVTEDTAGGPVSDTATFGVDTLAPNAVSSPSPAPNPAGWYGAGTPSVTVTHTCDPGTGAPLKANPTWPQTDTVSAEGVTTASPSGSCADVAGNTAAGSSFVVRIDRTAPTFTLAVSGGTLGAGGWYIAGTPTANYTCTETGSGLVGACPTDIPVAADTAAFTAPGGTVTDKAGNVSASVPAVTIKRDTTPPTKPVLSTLGPITNQVHPVFEWTESTDATSGVAGYRLHIQGGAFTYDTPANALIQGTGGPVQFPDLPENLTDGVTYTWTATAVDVAGRVNTSANGTFTVDASAPNPPTLSAGPTNGAATSDTTPTFDFAGLPGAQYRWQLKAADGTVIVPLTAYAPTATFTPATALPDGVYSFEVRQQTANGAESGFVTALFTVDTVAPGVPAITSSPGTTSSGQPSFGWRPAEQGGSFDWEVTGVGGARVQGPGTTTSTNLQLPTALVPGNYVFRVRQRDRAGNPGDWNLPEPFTVVAAPAPTDTTGTDTGGTTPVARFRPTTRNAHLLLPRVGRVVPRAKAVLTWKRAPGATLYNIQVFLIRGSSYRKIHSAFPRGRKYQVPAKLLRPGQRYVWRVWPYLGGRKAYSKNPLGISWFDTRPAS